MAKIPKISMVLVVGLIATLASGIPLKIRKGTRLRKMNDIEQPRDALSMGTAFTFAFLNAHTRPADPSRERLTLSLANGDSAKETNVYISSNYPAFSGIITKISPRDKLLIEIPLPEMQTDYMDEKLNQAVIENKGILLESDLPITVVAENSRQDGSAGETFVVLPICQLGKQYEVVGDEDEHGNPINIFSVTAVVDNTLVVFTHTLGIVRETLAKSQTLTFATDLNTLTSILITASEPVSVVSGSVCGYAYTSAQCSHEIPFVSLSNTVGATDHMVLAAEDNTSLYVDGLLIDTIDANDYYLFYGGAHFINATKRIGVIEFGGTRTDGLGAPFFVDAPSTSQFINDAVQFATALSEFEQHNVQHFIRIITDELATGQVAIDSIRPPALSYNRIGSSRYFYLDQHIGTGFHEVAPVGPMVHFSVTVYGYGVNTAYAFVPGLELKAIGTC